MSFLRLFLLLFSVAVSTATVSSAQTQRLWAVAVEYFRDQPDSSVTWERGTLSALGEYRHDPRVDRVTLNFYVPPAMRNRPVIMERDWEMYGRLGPHALANFRVATTDLGAGFRPVAGTTYGAVEPRETAHVAIGTVSNLSTRAELVPGAAPVISGFVIQQQSREVLIRGVGPALGPLGVANPASNPRITVYKSSLPHYTNDDWGTRPEADRIAATAARIGAFPLPAHSRDAAVLVELPPGAYTVHLEAGAGSGGTALLEIYVIEPTNTYDWETGEIM